MSYTPKIPFTPTAGLASTDVESAIEECAVGRLLSVTVLTSLTTANFTTAANTNKVRIRMTGGGGGGGGATAASSQCAVGSGGGGGGYSEGLFDVSPSTDYSYQCGEGGSGGAANNGTGVAGSNSTMTIGAFTIAAKGGAGGGAMGSGTTFQLGANAIPLLAATSDGYINKGTTFGGGNPYRTSGTSGLSGNGSDSMFGYGGPRTGTAQNGNAGGVGGGGGGGALSLSASGYTGGAGGNGRIIVEEYS